MHCECVLPGLSHRCTLVPLCRPPPATFRNIPGALTLSIVHVPVTLAGGGSPVILGGKGQKRERYVPYYIHDADAAAAAAAVPLVLVAITIATVNGIKPKEHVPPSTSYTLRTGRAGVEGPKGLTYGTFAESSHSHTLTHETNMYSPGGICIFVGIAAERSHKHCPLCRCVCLKTRK
jgi:hypothetical protein